MTYGIVRLIEDLKILGFDEVTVIQDSGNTSYALIPNFEILTGNFAGRIIDLAIPAPPQYPQMFGASIHVRATPHLVPFGPVPNLRNVIASNLGAAWQYWSYCFNISPVNPTSELISQINEIFRRN
ncbi:MAG: hypothetical protein EOP45_01060 [Sphingobacteriaceae bacterium]|nr:MAG: hypothetical protein EOP45_01060 [Sphingobacteriaceae bacterium]